MKQHLQNLREKMSAMHARAGVFRKMGLAATSSLYETRGAEGDAEKIVGLDEAFATALQADPQNDAEMKRMLEGAREKNMDDVTALQALRQTNIELFVRAMSNFAMFFEHIELAANEQSVYVSTYKNPVNVKFVGQDGHIGTQKAVKAQKQVYVDMREISAETGYQIRDINLGTDIVAAASGTVDLGWEMANRQDYELFKALINGNIFAPFNIGTNGASGALNSTLIPHWRIVQANLPTTNNLRLDNTNPQVAKLNLTPNGSGAGQSNAFRFDCVQAVIDYCASWGDIFGGPLEPTGAILVPSSDLSGMSASIKPTTLFFNKVAEGILQNYRQFEYMNKNWVMIPDVTLQPGCCYFVLRRKVGDWLTKPSMDWEDVETNKKKNWETRTQNKTFQTFIPEPQRVFIVRVIYNANYTDPVLL